MTGPDPTSHIWWLASRASGITAFLLISLSVLLGLAMATKILRGRVKAPVLVKLHESLALSGLVAIAVHAITLLGDAFLHPGPIGVLVPFTMDHAPVFTGLGVVAAYLAALLGLSYYVRRRIGTKRWRSLHRLTLLVYVLGVTHTLGAGTDASAIWLQAILIVTGAPILFLMLLRFLPGAGPAAARPAQPRPAPQPDRPAYPQPHPTLVSTEATS
ncbi:MAG: methionine sulfoxide reductase heme-binding subunit [Solirubrobacteraceae bacterium]|jgi:sulfoxide reductase heme-binding subunit YedZ|nr:methionine sulfoxide reductase heme-binding subunit [Solirubrobacteraceae bacterium]